MLNQTTVTRPVLFGILCFSLFFQSPCFSQDGVSDHDKYFIAGGVVAVLGFLGLGISIIGGKYEMPDRKKLFPKNYIRYRLSAAPCHTKKALGAEHKMIDRRQRYLCPEKVERFKGKIYKKSDQEWFRKALRPTFNAIYQKSAENRDALKNNYHPVVSMCANTSEWSQKGLPAQDNCIKQVFMQVLKKVCGGGYGQCAWNSIINLDQNEVEESMCADLPEFLVDGDNLSVFAWKRYCLVPEQGNALLLTSS